MSMTTVDIATEFVLFVTLILCYDDPSFSTSNDQLKVNLRLRFNGCLDCDCDRGCEGDLRFSLLSE